MRLPVACLLASACFVALAQQPGGGPPPEARSACAGLREGANCSVQTPHGRLAGVCRNAPEGFLCIPEAAGLPGPAPARDGQRPPGAGVGGGARPPSVDIAARDPGAQPVKSRIPDTGQGTCFDNARPIPCPRPGQPFHGQDAQYDGALPAYRDNGDGTISDRLTGLTWQRAHNPRRLGWYEARQACAALRLGGHRDWRLPGIRELFSIASFRGAVGRRPYLDELFEIRPPDASLLRDDPFAASHHPDMMGQTWSATLYAGEHWGQPGVEAAFFMNFLDGRIKQAPTRAPQRLFYRCVRGEAWGDNDFVDHGDGTVSDRAAGLTWQQADDGRPRNWAEALAYCENLTLAGRDDWRLPNIKELQSIVDYRRHDPALDPRHFRQSDRRGWFWSSTTHGDNIAQADYICFGKCVSVDGVDVHGAGAQRSDPKSGDANGRREQGGQRDEIRIRNYVRCVR